MRCRTCRTRGTEDRGVTQGVGHCDVVQCARHYEDIQGAKHRGAARCRIYDEVRGLEHVGRVRGAGKEGITQAAGHDEDV